MGYVRYRFESNAPGTTKMQEVIDDLEGEGFAVSISADQPTSLRFVDLTVFIPDAEVLTKTGNINKYSIKKIAEVGD